MILKTFCMILKKLLRLFIKSSASFFTKESVFFSITQISDFQIYKQFYSLIINAERSSFQPVRRTFRTVFTHEAW